MIHSFNGEDLSISYTELVNQTFGWCVHFLYYLAPKFGMTYAEINVLLFVVLHPLLTMLLLILNIHERRLNR